MRHAIFLPLLAAFVALIPATAGADGRPTASTTAGTTMADTTGSPAALPPKLAGARYGQALGSSLVCPYIHLQPAAETLLQRYTGADLDSFKAEAQQVALVWKKTLGCDPIADINRCRVLSEKSCSEAIREIGPAGTAVAGLIEFRK